MKGRRDRSTPGRAVASGSPPLRWGWLWLALGLVGYIGLFAVHPRLFFALGVAHYNVWFLDTFALLASNDAVTHGLNPYLGNPLDYLQRPHVYSHWWLHLRDLGLTRADSMWLGLTLAIAFLGAALCRLRPKSVPQLLWYAAVLGCPAVLLALDRANNDLVIFLLLAPVVPCLRHGRSLARWVVPLLIAVATALKYYPAVGLLLLCAEPDRRVRRGGLLIGGLLLALAGLSVAEDLTRLSALVPQPAGLTNFGAIGFFNELGWSGWVPRLVCAGFGLAILACAWWQRGLGDWEPEPAQQADWLHFLLGALLLTGCFFLNMNFSYRWIFAVWLAPMLWTMTRTTPAPAAVRRLARFTGGLLFVVLWWGPFCCLIVNSLIGMVSAATIMRLARLSFLLEQPMDWAFFSCLLVFLAHYLRRSLPRPARVFALPSES